MRALGGRSLATIALLPLLAAGTAGCVSYGTAVAGSARPAAVDRVKAVPAVASSSRAPAARPPKVTQRITVIADSYTTTYAKFVAYRWAHQHWVRVFGPWTARVGYNGIARPGQKDEGDGKTPSGTYGFGFDFGVLANPGVAVWYRRARSYDWWDDDPKSPNYNEWIDTRHHNAGSQPEPMDNQPAYNYGAVIAYNTKRVPDLGSAIFLHVGTGQSTAGCVSLPQSRLLKVLRWLRPADHPHIAISVRT
jgi:L,D-peptidoglycan transpeptidase YkuD (ErfK/YbiS/YcfS/YnhG family)